MTRTEPIRNPKQVKALLAYVRQKGNYRNLVLVTLGLYTALRVSDILSLCWNDVYDFKNRRIRESVTLTEKKTGKTKTFALHQNIINALTLYLREVPKANPSAPIIVNKQTEKAISRIQAHRIIKDSAKAAEISGNVSCHSLRKTFGYHAWKSGVQPILLMEIYNHSSYNTTRRYLGIAQDDKNAVYLNLTF